MAEKTPEKSEVAKREEAILKFWQDNQIFEKSLANPPAGGASAGEFVFYEGPPTANGRPGIHHLEARAFKDAIPRYKTMRGYHVRRKGGWDTHGLPVELQVEKELGLKSKKEVEGYGVGAFNQKCKESVWTYVKEWEEFTNRMGYWVDLANPYITYKAEYIESLWNIVKTVDDRGLLYKDYKVVPWCPRCGTALSSHELAQGYEDVKDLSVTIKFKLTSSAAGVFLLAWTTTPWTLPGNVGLAVGEKIKYVQVRVGEESLILAKDRLVALAGHEYQIEKEFLGRDLVGLEYEPLYPFLQENISGAEKEKLVNAYKVYPANFVTTEDGTGIVHTAVMYGQDDFELGTKVGLPKYHLVSEDGTFKPEAGFLAGKFVKDEAVAVEIIKDLASRGLLLAKQKYEHSYPFCWRCHTPLIYFARDSWYIRMSQLRDELVKENEQIHWEPERIREGRFGEWLREVKDWAISRERYWGTPLPVWLCDKCGEKKVVGSIAELAQAPRNTYFVMRHGEAENNVQQILSDEVPGQYHLTAKGKTDVAKAAEKLVTEKIDLIIASPVLRARETAEIMSEHLGLSKEKIIFDSRLREMGLGSCSGKNSQEFAQTFPLNQRFGDAPCGIENYISIQKRMGESLFALESKYAGKKILIITHGTPVLMLLALAQGLSRQQSLDLERDNYLHKSEIRPLNFKILPHNENFELDLHRPYIDEVEFKCKCDGEMARVKEVMDVWFDSGSMPFAQDHYPFSVSDKNLAYPADFISEAIDQTRGWFYTLHAVGILMGKGKAYQNVICLGHILDAEGKKMSKSLGNVVNPWAMMDKYGADALRFWMYSVNQPGDSKNFDEKTVDEVVKKVFNLVTNVVSFYQMYADPKIAASSESTNILDRWIMARMNQLVALSTRELDNYVLLEPARAIRDFVGDLSTWYLRRSRDRFKSEETADKRTAIATTRYILQKLAQVIAPFTPFVAEEIYQVVKAESDPESVHLSAWPEIRKIDQEILEKMEQARQIVSVSLELRARAGIKIRQPLALLTLREQLSPEYLPLIKDELNVEEIKFDVTLTEPAALDTIITPELKEKGEVRELIREIQNWRKDQDLQPGEKVTVPVAKAKKTLAEKFAEQILAATNGVAFSFVD